MLKKYVPFCVMCSVFLISAFAQKKNASAVKNPTTTKSLEAKNAVDALKKNPSQSQKPEVVIVYNEDFEKGEELFQLNKPEEAIAYFEKSLESEQVNPAVYIYLGVCYYQIEKYDKSLAVCVQGLAKEGTDKKILAYNAGNACYAMGNYMRADASYAIAIKEDPNYAPAVLNRANAQLKLDHLEDAKNSYVHYLEIETDSPQRERIERIISLLGEEIERRAKQKPELINPDSFVANEKMEVPEPPEKVEEELPSVIVVPAVAEELVSDDAHAPMLPADQIVQTASVEKVSDDTLSDAMESDIVASPDPAQKIQAIQTESDLASAEKIDMPDLEPHGGIQQPVSESKTAEKESPNSELVRNHEDEARFAEEARLAIESEKSRLEEEARKNAEAEASRRAAEEAERRRDEEMRIVLEVEKVRLAEEARKALEAEKARLAEESRKALEEERAKLDEEWQKIEEEKRKLQ